MRQHAGWQRRLELALVEVRTEDRAEDQSERRVGHHRRTEPGHRALPDEAEFLLAFASRSRTRALWSPTHSLVMVLVAPHHPGGLRAGRFVKPRTRLRGLSREKRKYP
jgi:hypothetical protein